MALQRTRDSVLAIFASFCRCINRIKKIWWPCRCGCTWTVSCSWVCVDNMDRTNPLYHEKEENDGGLELLCSHRQSTRELPPLPNHDVQCNLRSANNQICDDRESRDQKPDFWASIEKVKQARYVYP